MITEMTRDAYDTRHGGAFDRGSADSYYHRPRQPHFYVDGTGTSDRVEQDQMTRSEIQAYLAGYQYNEQFGDKKDWG
jgi:hypothetical protein